jgi:hypothetical protein
LSDTQRNIVAWTRANAVELGCGTACFSAWPARLGARPVGVDPTSAQLATARSFQSDLVARPYCSDVTVEWARQWPAEQIWIARKR